MRQWYCAPLAGLVLYGSIFSITGAYAEQTNSSLPVELVLNLRHPRIVSASAISADGRSVVTGENDVRLWDTKTGRLVRIFSGHTDGINAVALSPDGKRIVSGSDDKSIKVWDAATGKLLLDIGGLEVSVKSLAVSPDGAYVFFSGIYGSKGKLQQLSATTGQLVRSFGSDEGPWRVILSEAGDRLLSNSGDDRSVVLWDVASGKVLYRFAEQYSRGFALSANGQRVAIATDRILKIFDVSGRLVRSIQTTGDTASVGFSADGNQVAVVSKDSVIRILDVETGKQSRSFQASQTVPAALTDRATFSMDGALVVTSGNSGGDVALSMWDLKSGRLQTTFGIVAHDVNAFDVSPSGGTLAAGGSDKILRRWDLTTGKLLSQVKGFTSAVRSVSFSTDGSRILSSDEDGGVRTWSALMSPASKSFQIAKQPREVTFSPSGKQVYGAGALWDVQSGKSLRKFGDDDSGREAFSPDGTRLVRNLGYPSAQIKMFEVATGKTLFSIPTSKDGIAAVKFSPDGGSFLSTIGERSMSLFDSQSGRLLRTFDMNAHIKGAIGDTLTKVGFSPDGKMALSASRRDIILWDIANGSLLRTIHDDRHLMNDVAFSPDGKWLIEAVDSSVLIWDRVSGALVVTLVAAVDGEWLAITPEGFFVSSEHGGDAVGVVRGLEVLAVDQFYQALYRPDLVREKLAGDPRGLVRQAAANLDLNRVIASGGAPDVAIAILGRDPALTTIDVSTVSVQAQIVTTGGGIGRVEWRINGVTVGVDTPTPGAVSPLQITRSLTLDPGTNRVEVTAYNAANLVASIPARLTLTTPQNVAAPSVQATPVQKPRLFALVVGINSYADSRIRLEYAVPDAKEVARALNEATGSLYQSVQIKSMIDSDATRDKIDGAIREIAAVAQPSDVFVLYFAGHGMTIDGRYYFIPQNFIITGERDQKNAESAVKGKGISQEQLQLWFASIPARKGVILFDTCDSGTLTGDAAVTQTLEKGAANDRLAQSTGRSIITASAGTQEANEGFNGHGLFTYELLDAINRADSDRNGTIEVSELAAYVYAQVSQLSMKTFNKQQVPQVKLATNFSVTKQARIIADDVPPVAEAKPTFQVAQASDLQVQPGTGATVVRSLLAKSQVNVIESKNGWSLISSGGKPIGYVATQDLVPMQ